MIEFNATFIIAMFSFVVFIMIMNAIYYRPVLNIIRKREDYINSNYDEAKENEISSKNIEDERNNKLNMAKVECKKLFYKEIAKLQEASSLKIKEAKEFNKEHIRKEKDRLLKDESLVQSELKETCFDNLVESVTSKILNGNTVEVRK